MAQALQKTFGIFFAFLIGFLFPELHAYEEWMRWGILCMLMITFLRVHVRQMRVYRQHFYILIAIVTMALVFFKIGDYFGHREIGILAFFLTMTPTATSAPTVVGYLKGNPEFALTGVLLSSLVVSALMPFLLPIVLGKPVLGLMNQIMLSLIFILGVPAVASALIKWVFPRIQEYDSIMDKVQWTLWIGILILVAANGSFFIRNHESLGMSVLVWVALLSFVICALSFTIGYKIGGKQYALECSQCLGQKNTALSIYLASIYASPIIVLAITFYVVFHNLWSAWQIYHRAKLRGVQGSEPDVVSDL